MSTQNIVERILSDANAEAEKIINDGKLNAARIRQKCAEDNKLKQDEAQVEVRAKITFLTEKKQAAARLECAKLALSAKRRVIDQIYAMALSRLISLEKEQTLELAERLLESYAEQGDVIHLAQNFAYEKDLKLLPVIKAKGLSICEERESIDGGMILVGKISDKDLSYGALLSADRAQFESEIAAKIFND